MNGCILAIDGLAVKTRCPYKWEVINRKDFRNRKEGFGIVVLAGSDVRGKFYFPTSVDYARTATQIKN